MNWDYDFDDAQNAALSALIYKYAMVGSVFDSLSLDLGPRTPPPWCRRLWWRIDPWLPRVHLGPCDHEGCE